MCAQYACTHVKVLHRTRAQRARTRFAVHCRSVSTALCWLQVLRYGLGQEYKRHMDTLHDDDAGPRVCTILMYLNGEQSCMHAELCCDHAHVLQQHLVLAQSAQDKRMARS